MIHEIGRHYLIHGDSLEVLPTLDADSVDAIVSDPPYGLGFMGKSWDQSLPCQSMTAELLRVLKPGGHALLFGGTRTYHRLAVALEDAGFELRDCLSWLYGTGFPKSLDVSKAIDQARIEDEPSDAARQWQGWGTALKPAWEPIIMARKPLIGTVAANVQAHGTGGINVDACRIDATDKTPAPVGTYGRTYSLGPSGFTGERDGRSDQLGRWPANVVIDEEAAAILDEQSGGASRFFYVAKPSRAERDRGCDALPVRSGGEATDREDDSPGTRSPRAGSGRTGGARNFHPTVKPSALIRHLLKLVTRPGGVVLDPYCGSGTIYLAAEGLDLSVVGIERDPEYVQIALARGSSAL